MSLNSRSVWLRRGKISDPDFYAPGKDSDFELTAIGISAARETLLTAAPHMAAIWTDLFHSILDPTPKLRWLGEGPGVGRDARIAYSSLLGRYLARAYLTEHEGLRILIPLDVAKRCLQKTPYAIEKNPPSRGDEADWIGLDNQGLVIVEAKGTYDDKGVKVWAGKHRSPQKLKTAIDQVERTAIFKRRPRRRLQAKRWAIASRWGTQCNGKDPTLLAAHSGEGRLPEEDYRALFHIFLRADLMGVLAGLGHQEAIEVTNVAHASTSIPSELRVRAASFDLGAGLVAAVGPFGVRPLSNGDDVAQLERVRELNPNVVVASLSSRYITAVSRDMSQPDEEMEKGIETTGAATERFASRAGLTVVWLTAGETLTL